PCRAGGRPGAREAPAWWPGCACSARSGRARRALRAATTPAANGSSRGGGRRWSPCSKPEGGLGDDVALDLVRAGVDRRLAIVEVDRRRAGRPRVEAVVVDGAEGMRLRAIG